METEVVRRRVHKIAGHFVAPTNDDIISSTTHLLPMNCSGFNSVIRRCDNRMYFARQASSSQGCFMRPSSSEQSPCNASEAPLFARPSLPLKCSRLTDEGSCNTSEAPLFSRPSLPLKCSGFINEGYCMASEAPMFCRPARMELNNAKFSKIQPQVQDCNLSTSDIPKFSEPDRRIRPKEQFCLKKKTYLSESRGAPRMDVRELVHNYVMIIEIPGVGINDIRVEVDDQNLIVMAKHSDKHWQVTGNSNGAYHRREYREEPYQVVWPIPSDVNKDSISAEFLNGFLQIIIPKL
ncbi:uncharacterized protein LOC116114880 [Pistacia vera]|uniref:uncharacterized protein LOC116114880 n=1 Tax=Pistacia vera TaxID=55513 RepID=UPI001263CCDB|nr:uncharacterized protein LOC116114880 [Pistacia vera]